MAGMRTFMILEQVIADFVDHVGPAGGSRDLIGISLYDLSGSRLHVCSCSQRYRDSRTQLYSGS
jgi:hypothetical protein